MGTKISNKQIEQRIRNILSTIPSNQRSLQKERLQKALHNIRRKKKQVKLLDFCKQYKIRIY